MTTGHVPRLSDRETPQYKSRNNKAYVTSSRKEINIKRRKKPSPGPGRRDVRRRTLAQGSPTSRINGRGSPAVAPKTTYAWILKSHDILSREFRYQSFLPLEETQRPGDGKWQHSASVQGPGAPGAPVVTEHRQKARLLFLFTGIFSVLFGDPRTNVFLLNEGLEQRPRRTYPPTENTQVLWKPSDTPRNPGPQRLGRHSGRLTLISSNPKPSPWGGGV